MNKLFLNIILILIIIITYNASCVSAMTGHVGIEIKNPLEIKEVIIQEEFVDKLEDFSKPNFKENKISCEKYLTYESNLESEYTWYEDNVKMQENTKSIIPKENKAYFCEIKIITESGIELNKKSQEFKIIKNENQITGNVVQSTTNQTPSIISILLLVIITIAVTLIITMSRKRQT